MGNEKAKILLVDDDAGLLTLLSMRLMSAGYHVQTALDGLQCLKLIDIYEPDLLISDLKMDHMDGMELFEAVSRMKPLLPVIIITAHGTIPEAVVATQKGVFSFLSKPIDKDELLHVIEQALSQSGRQNEHVEAWRSEIITQSPKMLDLLRQASLIAQSESNVLITGESGTGKELLASSLHKASSRSNGPFIAINCAAIPAELLESELFGHTRGAFTGAEKEHKGLFVAAQGGTLFLDEIGDMPLHLQVKLLRVLEERRIRPVGSTTSQPIDVRILSATHQDLGRMVEQQSFREDLFYRLNVIHLRLPALDERKEDIPLLAKKFLQTISERHRPQVKSFAPKALEKLSQVRWPGNVRQLYNFVERLVVLSQTTVISEAAVIEALSPNYSKAKSLAEAKSEFERAYLIQVLKQAKGNVTKAARSARRNRTDFYKLMARHDLQPAHFKSSS
ncbi:MAG: sigma 54-interacting transcriptional regulator [Oligoflexus sp.]